jgi:phosphoglycolate phosphatase-like HAD superfamily hydrolase
METKGNQMAYVIFDLDGTVIDSTHRQATKADGSLDLDHWFENNTQDKIMRDSLLPLANSMRALMATGHKIVICTARAIQPADKLFLAINRLAYDALLHREIGNMEGDASLKVRLLEEYFIAEGFDNAAQAKPIMFDDNLKVIEAMLSIGIKCYDATKVNKRLAA